MYFAVQLKITQSGAMALLSNKYVDYEFDKAYSIFNVKFFKPTDPIFKIIFSFEGKFHCEGDGL